MNLKKVKRVGIVGAGEAGLATAKMLIESGFECAVFERNSRVGGVWTDGYLDFGVQVQHELYEIPDFPLPPGTPDFTPGPTICGYLQDYADEYGVTPHIKLNTLVTGVDALNEGNSGWSIRYMGQDHIEHTEVFDLAVIAIGVYSHTPNIPRFLNQSGFRGQIMHNSTLKSKDQLKGRRVAVIGFGKSATDAALLAVEHADEATVIFREPRWPIPSRLLGLIPVKYALFNRFTNAMLPPHMHASRGIRAWHKIGKPFIWAFWRLVEKLIAMQFGLNRPRWGTSAVEADLLPKHPIEYDGFSNSTMLPKMEFFEAMHNGRLGAQRGSISSFTRDGFILDTGIEVQCDTVILATGWKTDYGFLPEGIQRRIGFEEDGYYLYRQIFHPSIPKLAFIGSNATTYINILTHNLQARWLVELLKGTHELPDAKAMQKEIEEMKVWKRKVVPPSKARAATLHLHMQQYHDELLRDMGLSHRLKRGLFGFLKEIFAPYQPSDYAAVSSGKAFEKSEQLAQANGIASVGAEPVRA